MNFKILFILFLAFSILPLSEIHAQSSNTGFVSGSIWYSKDPLEEGDKIKIYTFIFNPDSRELSGTVLFFDKTVLLGKKEFIIPPKGAEDVSIDWIVRAGDHAIFGKIENSRFLISKGKYEEVYLPENETEKNLITVSKKIISKEKNTDTTEDKTLSSATISNIKKIIEEKTPDFIAEPIISATNKLEEIRGNISIATEYKEGGVKDKIKALETNKNSQKENAIPNPILKPFRYAELFFLSVALFIFQHKILFYGLLIIIIFSILRYFFNKILG